MKASQLVQKMYIQFFGSKNMDLFSEIFHPKLKISFQEDIIMSYREYESFCRKTFTQPVEIISEFKKETFLEIKNRFSCKALITLNHQVEGKTQFLVSLFAKIKDEKIWDFKVKSQYEWTTLDYLIAPIADVLNDFKISSCELPNDSNLL